MTGSYVYGNQTTGFMKYEEFCACLSDSFRVGTPYLPVVNSHLSCGLYTSLFIEIP
jgi:hypothetical protein